MKKVLLIPKINILNANALSSPYTIGFPAMTAWLGAVHALERKLNIHSAFENIRFKGVAVICHKFNLQVHKDSSDRIYSIIATGKPLNKHGERCAFVEEARCHLNVSLVVLCGGVSSIDESAMIETVKQCLISMKIASGDVLDFGMPDLINVQDIAGYKELMRHLIPGHCLIERRDLMTKSMEEGEDAIDAILGYLTVFHRCSKDQNGQVMWNSGRKQDGWIVPVATGFHGVSELDFAENQRDPVTLHRFAESIVTLGEFVAPYRINNLEDMLWYAKVDMKNDLYLCQQN